LGDASAAILYTLTQTSPTHYNELSIVIAFGCQLLVQIREKVHCQNGGPTSREGSFLSPFVHRRREKVHPVPTKVFLKLSPDTAMLFAPFGCTPCPVLSAHAEPISGAPMDIAGSDIMKLESRRLHPGKC